MFRFRFFILVAITWLAFIFNLEAILRKFAITLHIQSFVYLLVVGIAFGLMLILKLRRVQTAVSVSTLVLLYAIAKVVFPTGLSMEYFLTEVVIELALVLGTYFAIRPLADWLGNYNNRLKQAVFSPTNTLMVDSTVNIAAIERKISLARRFERNLSLLYIPMNVSYRNSEDIKNAALQRKINELVNVLLGNAGLHAWHNGDLMVCLQDEAVDHVDTIAEQFSNLLADVLKMKVQIGVASFPIHGLLLDDLIEKASKTPGQPLSATQNTKVLEFYPRQVRATRTVSA